MTKVILDEYGFRVSSPLALEEALNPLTHVDSQYGEGNLEFMRRRQDALGEAIGRLLAFFVVEDGATIAELLPVAGFDGKFSELVEEGEDDEEELEQTDEPDGG